MLRVAMVPIQWISTLIPRASLPAMRVGYGMVLLLACVSSFTVRAGETESQDEIRRDKAREFRIYDFEPRSDDIWAHRDRNEDNWPDYWEPIIDEDHRAQAVNRAGIVVDAGRPGYYLGMPGHVFKVPFDGTPIAIQTRFPKVVDPDLAYEISVFGRMQRLNHSIMRVWLVWLNMDDEGYAHELDRDALRIPPGQVDWPEAPITLRINDLPSRDGVRANRLRVLLEVVDDPAIPGADRHGIAWFDDIRIESRPKLRIAPVIREYDPANPSTLVPLRIGYLGLVENIPPEERVGDERKRYSRSLSIVDVFGREPRDRTGVPLLDGRIRRQRVIDPGPSREYDELINVDLNRFGLYYVTARLFGHDRTIQASVSQVIGLLPPPGSGRPGARELIESAGTFGVVLKSPPSSLLEKKGRLSELVRKTGVRQVKVDLWPPEIKDERLAVYISLLSQELRRIRTLGGRITGVISSSPERFSEIGMQQVMKERTGDLKTLFEQTALHLGPHIEAWQWGSDSDASFSDHFDANALQPAHQALSNLTSVMTNVYPLVLGPQRVTRPPQQAAQAISIYIPPEFDLEQMLSRIAPVVPDELYRMHNERLYPSDALKAAAPPRRIGDDLVLQTNSTTTEPWVSIGLKNVSRHTRSVVDERLQLEDMATKAILARAIGIKHIFLGQLVGEGSSLANMEKNEDVTPRPTLLAARVLEERLGGRKYLGSLELWSPPRSVNDTPKQFPNFVFGDADNRNAVIAIWYGGPGESERLDRVSIANTPLRLIDMAGNVQVIEREPTLQIHKTPLLIEGLSVPLLRTRMSVRIADDPPLLSRTTLQPQVIRIGNYFPDRQLTAELQLEYAADNAFQLEQNWTVRPATVDDINLPGATKSQIPFTSIPYEVKPSNTSRMGLRPDSEQADKYAQLTLDLSVSPPVRMKLIRRTRLRSDLQVVVEKPDQQPDARDVQLHLYLRWLPDAAGNPQNSITLEPFYARQAELPTRLRKVVVPRYTQQTADTPARIVRIRVPRTRSRESVWIGLEEDGGNRFWRADVTHLVPPLGDF